MRIARSVDWLEGVLERDFEISNETEMVSDDGLESISKLLPIYLGGGDWANVGRELVTRQGKFARRVAARCYKAYGTKLDSKTIEQIGNVANQNVVRGGDYIARVDRELWEPGTFGDDGSCFWMSRRGAPKLILRHGGAAIKLYSAEDRSPISRAWIAPRLGRGVIFNTYTVRGKPTLNTDNLGSLVTLSGGPFSGFGVRPIRKLTNYGYDNETLWINGGSGTLIHKPGEVWGMDSLDLRIKLFRTCVSCGEMPDDIISYLGSSYCERCYPVKECSHCGVSEDTTFGKMVGDDYLCRACSALSHRNCCECSGYFYTGNMTYEGNFHWRCNRCTERQAQVSERARAGLGGIHRVVLRSGDGTSVDLRLHPMATSNSFPIFGEIVDEGLAPSMMRAYYGAFVDTDEDE